MEGQRFILVNKLQEDEESDKRVERNFQDRGKRLRRENRNNVNLQTVELVR